MLSTDELEQRQTEGYKRYLFETILMPCVDCGDLFTRSAKASGPCATTRCPTHRKARYNSNHGGDHRRCKKFGVPYDSSINRIIVLEKDDYHCYRCGIETPKEKRGTYEPDAPEVDHVWSLGEIRNGIKSPGHVYSNLRCICRKCNSEKNKSIKNRPTGSHEAFHKERLNGWLTKPNVDVETHIVCAHCGKPTIKQRVNAKYCSKKCGHASANKRETNCRVKLPIKRFSQCLLCGDTFTPRKFNQKFCTGAHQVQYKKSKRPKETKPTPSPEIQKITYDTLVLNKYKPLKPGILSDEAVTRIRRYRSGWFARI